MSTVIRHAYRLPVGADPFAQIADIRAAVVPAVLAADAEMTAARAVFFIDEHSLHRDTSLLPCVPVTNGRPAPLYRPNSPWSSAQEIIAHAESQEPKGSAFTDLHRCEIVFLPDESRMLAMVFAEDPDILSALDHVAGALGWEEWGMDTRVEEPEEERSDSWDRALGFRAPVEVGMSLFVKPPYKLGTTPTLSGLDEDEKTAMREAPVPSAVERLTRMLTRALVDVRAEGAPTQGKKSVWQDVVSAFSASSSISDVRRAKESDHPVWVDLLGQMRALSVEDMRRSPEPVLGHSMSSRILCAAAQKIRGIGR